jgi:hypothetical protein
VLQADRDAIDALLQEALVEPAGGVVDYRCAHGSIMVTFTKIERLASGEQPDRDCGYMSEREVSVWCLAADVASENRLVWYLPYVFTDTGQTVATGREVYGYPKQIGRFDDDFPAGLSNGGEAQAWALAIDPFDKDEDAVWRRMVHVDHTPTSDPVIGGSGFGGFTILAEAMSVFTAGLHVSEDLPFGPADEAAAQITAVDAPPPPRTPAPRPWIRRLLDTPAGRGLSEDPDALIAEMVTNPMLVFLKQFRDAWCPTKACYQAVVEAPLAIRAGGAWYETLDPTAFGITVEDWASHPLATDLGVQARKPLTPDHAFRATLNFDIMLGQEVWRAPT